MTSLLPLRHDKNDLDVEDRKYSRLRALLVEDLYHKGIKDERVLEAIGNVPRHLFVDQALRQRAYEDEALPIGLNQTISQPYTVAFQTTLLNPQKGERILEIGTGSGYQAAVLSLMGARVFTVERHKLLYERARALLKELGYRIVTHFGDGTLGWRAFAPYDKILVTAGASGVPTDLLEQLSLPKGDAQGGSLIIPIGDRRGQVMKCITRTGPDEYSQVDTKSFRFVPLIGDGDLS